MREIKFRGQTYDTPPHWVFGDLYHYTTGEPAINYTHPHQKWLESEPVRPETVGQFTGLLDSTGNEIYEGDVIKTREGDVGVIVWETELGGFRARLTDDSFYTLTALFTSMFSVIGNIYDNSDLLEAHA